MKLFRFKYYLNEEEKIRCWDNNITKDMIQNEVLNSIKDNQFYECGCSWIIDLGNDLEIQFSISNINKNYVYKEILVDIDAIFQKDLKEN